MTVRWGVLSTARINDLVLPGAARTSSAEFVAVGSRDADRAAAYAEKHSLAYSFGSYDELLASDAIDAVYISLPNAMHAEWSLKALLAGKHVLCEKPFGRDPSVVQNVVDQAEAAGLLLAEGFMYRFHPQTIRIREVVAGGEIGEVRHINATLRFALDRDLATDSRGSRSLQGGALMDVGCYCISGSRLYLGEPSWVFCRGEISGEVDVRLFGVLGFSNGVTASVDGAVNLPDRHRLEIVGTTGSIVVRDPWHCRGSSFRIRRQGAEDVEVKVEEPSLHYDIVDAYAAELDTVSRAIANGDGDAELPVAADDPVSQARAICAMDDALRTGEVVSLDPL